MLECLRLALELLRVSSLSAIFAFKAMWLCKIDVKQRF